MRQLKQQSLRRRRSNIVSTKQNLADPWIMTTKEHEFWWICRTNVDPCFLAWTPEKLITKNIWQKRRGKGGKTLIPRTPSIATIFFKAWPISLCFCKVISHPLLVSSWKAHLWNCKKTPQSRFKGNCVLMEQLNSITTRSRPTRTLNKWLYKQEPPHATTVQLSASE